MESSAILFLMPVLGTERSKQQENFRSKLIFLFSHFSTSCRSKLKSINEHAAFSFGNFLKTKKIYKIIKATRVLRAHKIDWISFLMHHNIEAKWNFASSWCNDLSDELLKQRHTAAAFLISHNYITLLLLFSLCFNFTPFYS